MWSFEVADINRAKRIRRGQTASVAINVKRFGQLMESIVSRDATPEEVFEYLERVIGKHATTACRELVQ